MSVTGERVTTPEGGFNPTWQRHVAAYRLCAPLLPQGRVLDLGCGVGHSFRELAPRESVGLDVEPEALEGQDRETVVADMREIPFPAESFDSVLAVQSIEHVPDPEPVLAEVARVLQPEGVAVFVTPNRLTFARPDEIIDPYHYVEYDPDELRVLCEPWFESVDVLGLFGSERYRALVAEELRRLDALLRKDPLRLRRLLPRRLRQWLYDRRLRHERSDPNPVARQIEVADFELRGGRVEEALDVVAVCRRPLSSPRVAGAGASTGAMRSERLPPGSPPAPSPPPSTRDDRRTAQRGLRWRAWTRARGASLWWTRSALQPPWPSSCITWPATRARTR